MALDGYFALYRKGLELGKESSPDCMSVRRVCPLPYRLIILLYEPSALFTT